MKKIMGKFSWSFFSFLILMTQSFGAAEITESQRKDKVKEYTLAVEDINYFPFHGFKNEELGGYLKDVLEAFSKDTNIHFKIMAMPMIRGWNEYLAGNINFKYPDNPSWSPDKKAAIPITYSDSVVEYTDGFSTTYQNRNLNLQNLQSFTSVLGFTSWGKEVDELLAQKKLDHEVTRGLESSVQQVLLGRVQAVYSEVSVAQFIRQEKKMKGQLVFNKNLPFTQGSYLLSTNKYPEIIAQFNEWLKKNVAKLAELRKKHGIHGPP